MSIILVSITQTFFHVLSKRSILCRNTRGWHCLDVSGSKDTPPSTRFIWVIWVGRWTFVVGLADQTWKHTFKRNPADGAAMLHGAVTWRFWKAKLCQQLAILCYPMNIYIYNIIWIISEKDPKPANLGQFPSWIWRSWWNPGCSMVQHSWMALNLNAKSPWITLMLRRLAPRTCGQAQNAGCWVTGGWLCCPVNVCSQWLIMPWNLSGSAQGQEIKNKWRRQSFKCCRSSYWKSGSPCADKRSKLVAAQCWNMSKLHCTNSSV